MSNPFFTIAIPTKNRPDLCANAVRSVLQQTFQDVELIVCDNSDAAEATRTAALVKSFDDRRIQYVRTNGRLSMPDNWEHAIAEATGEFVGVLTDRSVFRRDALQTVHDAIQRTGIRVACWFPDKFGRDPEGRTFQQRRCSLRAHEFDSPVVLNYFLHGHPKYSNKVIPKLMTGVCHRSVLAQIRSSPVGRVCPPVAPDFTSGILILAHTDKVLLIDDGLYVSCGRGNGSSFRQRGALAKRFLQDLGMTWKDLVQLMPTEACFPHGLVLNDFLRLKQRLPELFGPFELDRAQYYLGCLSDYTRAARQGADLSQDLDILIEGLSLEAEGVQHSVRCRQIYLNAVAILPPRAATSAEAVDDEDDGANGDTVPRFDTVFEALSWAEAHPRTGSADSPATMPEFDTLRRWDRSGKSKTAAMAEGR